MKELLIRMVAVLAVSSLSACSTHLVSLKYVPSKDLASEDRGPLVASASSSDDRGTENDWLGAIRGGYGNRLKTLRTEKPTSESVTESMISALRARNMLGTPDTSSKTIEVSIVKFDCNYYFNREAHAHLLVKVISLPQRSTVFAHLYKTDNSESGTGAGIFGSVDHLAGFAQRTLNETIDKVFADPGFMVALSATSNETTPVGASAADRLRQLENLRKDGLINESEFESKRTEILKGL